MENDDNIEQGQSPPARVAHHRGQNVAAPPEKPDVPTRSAGGSLATSGTTIASFFVRLQTTPAAPAPQAPAAALDEPATATRVTPATTVRPSPPTVSAVPAQLVACQAPASAAPGPPAAAAPTPPAAAAPGLKA